MSISKNKVKKNDDFSLVKELLSKKQAKVQRYWTGEDKKTVFQEMLLYDKTYNPQFDMVLRLKENKSVPEVGESIYQLESFSVSKIKRTSRNFPLDNGPEWSNKDVLLNEDYPVNIIVLDCDSLLLKASDYKVLFPFVLGAYLNNPHDGVWIDWQDESGSLSYPITFNERHFDDIIQVDHRNIDEVRDRIAYKDLDCFVPKDKANLDSEYDNLLADSIQRVLRPFVDLPFDYGPSISIDYTDKYGQHFNGLDTVSVHDGDIIIPHCLVMTNAKDIAPVHCLNSQEIIDMFSTTPDYVKSGLGGAIQSYLENAAKKISKSEKLVKSNVAQVKL